MGFVFQMFMLTNYCRSLESEVFPGKAGMAEMSFMLLFGAVLMWIVSYLMVLPFLGTSMLFFIIYIWSRKQPQRPVSLWGFGLKGWQLPFALMVIGLLMGGSPVMDIIGLLCGHCFHFLTDIVPLAYGRQVLVCPQFLYGLFDRDARPARPAFAGQGNRLS